MKSAMDRWFNKTNKEWNLWLWDWTLGWAIVAIVLTMISSPCRSQTIFGRNPFYQEPNLSSQNYTPPAAWPQYTSGAGFWGWFTAVFKSS